MKKIGATFGAELIAAGLAGVPISFGGDGNINFGENISSVDRAAVMAVYEAHDPVVSERSKKWESIKAERDRRTEQGGFKVGDKWFHSDQKSRSQQQDNEAAGEDLVQEDWKTMNGTFVTMTTDLARLIRLARMSSDRAIFVAAEKHRSAMEVCENPDSYDFSGGWPQSFDEFTAKLEE